jgi:transcriptional regulator with XRE-family HTH domain
MSSARRERVRRSSRRPIEVWEVPHLERLGQLLRQQRKAASLTQRELGNAAELSLGTISQIELGDRRTRHSTLRRIAAALVAAQPSLTDSNALAASLAEAAGPALAPESIYRDRVDRRRRRRVCKGRYGPRQAGPYPGETIRAYLARLDRHGMIPRRDLTYPSCSAMLDPSR